MSDEELPEGISHVTDFNIYWDPEGAKQAWVYVSPGRIEILLAYKDAELVQQILEMIPEGPAFVVGCQDLEGPDPGPRVEEEAKREVPPARWPWWRRMWWYL